MLEVQASLRLMGGQAALLRQVQQTAANHGWDRMATAPTARAAWALLNQPENPMPVPAENWMEQLDTLPIDCLMAARSHRPILNSMGCRTLGQLRCLPRHGLAQRFGSPLLLALDQAYAYQSEVFEWLTLPETFDLTRELPWTIDSIPDLLRFLADMLKSAEGWLQARLAGTTSMTVFCIPEPLRHQHNTPQELLVHTRQASRHSPHWTQLFQEQLARTALHAPTAALRLQIPETTPLLTPSHSWLPDGNQTQIQLDRCMERLAARLGEQNIRRAKTQADHRLSRMQAWTTAAPESIRARTPGPPGHAALQPVWLLPSPIALHVVQQRPQFHGPLALLTRPWRVETGWWDDAESDRVARDYFIAHSAHAGLLCVYHQRAAFHATENVAQWFLHGFYG